MALFLDTSAVLKLLVNESGSDVMAEIGSRPSDWGGAFISAYTTLEVYCCLARFRRSRTLSSTGYRDSHRLFGEYMREVLAEQPAEIAHVDEAAGLALRHWKRGVGSLDLLQVSGALALAALMDPDPVIFVTSDGSQRHLCKKLGFDTFDPEKDDLTRLGPPMLPLNDRR